MTRKVKVALIVALIYIVFDVAVWFIISALEVSGRNRWIAFLILALLGLVASIVLVWYLVQRLPSAGPQDDALEQLFVAARGYLQSAPATRGKALSTLPGVIVLGPPGSAKTTTVVRSPIDMTLLAGQVKRADDAAPLPTSLANIWYSGGTLLFEVGGPLLQDKERWPRFVRRLPAARGLSTLFKGVQAARVAVVCLSCEDLARPDAAEVLAAAAGPLHAGLSQLASTLGVRLPVYVVFTKADHVSGFDEVVGALSRDEIRDVFGATLPIEGDQPAGTYAERQSQRLTASFTRLYGSLALDRIRVLARGGGGPSATEQRARGYEFAREFRKLTPAAVNFLVELCRPNPLRASPFLRGFYFAGVRAVVDEASAAAAAVRSELEAPARSAATAILSAPVGLSSRAPASYVPGGSGPRRKPQWVFLDRVLSDVVLADRAAIGLTTEGRRVDVLRRAVLGGIAAVALVLAIGTTVSFLSNRALRDRVDAAMATLAALPASIAEPPSKAALSALDTMRILARRLEAYDDQSPPLHLRWGLYAGSPLIAPARRAYFDAFDRLLFSHTRAALVRELGGLGNAAPTPALYDSAYSALQAYLTVTDYPDSSTAATSIPLTAAWAAGFTTDKDLIALAEPQFTYFALTLPHYKPYSFKSDQHVVQVGRDYVNQFGSGMRVYKVMIDAVNSAAKPVSLNGDYPATRDYVLSDHVVPGAYTRDGWARMTRELTRISKYVTAAQWVTGAPGLTRQEQDSVAAAVKKQYDTDYANEWRDYLRSAKVVPAGNLRDAGNHIQALAGPGSPLLRFLAIASVNTAVDTTSVGKPFQPVRAVVPAAAGDALIQQPNQPYMQALFKLGAAAAGAADAGGGADQVKAAQDAALQVNDAAGQLSQQFQVDAVGNVDRTVRSLLEAPAASAGRLLQTTRQASTKADDFCQGFQALATKYPFTTGAADATIGEFSDMFRPGGGFSRFIQGPLSDLVVREGGRIVGRANASPRVSDAFVKFLNRLNAITQTFYGGATQDPTLNFSIRGVTNRDVPRLHLSVDAQGSQWTSGDTHAQNYAWNGRQARRATIDVQYGPQQTTDTTKYSGTWAIIHLFGDEPTSRQHQGIVDQYDWQIGGAGGSKSNAPRFTINVEGSGRAAISRELFANLQQCPPMTDR